MCSAWRTGPDRAAARLRGCTRRGSVDRELDGVPGVRALPLHRRHHVGLVVGLVRVRVDQIQEPREEGRHRPAADVVPGCVLTRCASVPQRELVAGADVVLVEGPLDVEEVRDALRRDAVDAALVGFGRLGTVGEGRDRGVGAAGVVGDLTVVGVLVPISRGGERQHQRERARRPEQGHRSMSVPRSSHPSSIVGELPPRTRVVPVRSTPGSPSDGHGHRSCTPTGTRPDRARTAPRRLSCASGCDQPRRLSDVPWA
jgi:hypothetical protein